ncbi:MAG: hypothetical protein OER82_09580 [Nitrosopumilus sp.]|nr:hypothetical protein [Nitrosopumilus sp.]
MKVQIQVGACYAGGRDRAAPCNHNFWYNEKYNGKNMSEDKNEYLWTLQVTDIDYDVS